MSGWNKSKTSLQEVGNSLYRTMKVVCRQENTSGGQAEFTAGMGTPNSSAYKGEFRLLFPQEWNISAVTMVAVESACLDGMPTINGADETPAFAGGREWKGQCPRTFSIRSNSLGGSSVIEAKRWRGNVAEVVSNVPIGDRRIFPFSDKMGVQYTTKHNLDFIETANSNLLQSVPNTEFLNWERDAAVRRGDISEIDQTFYCYSVRFHQEVNLQSMGTILPMTSAQTTIDLYITAGADYPLRNNVDLNYADATAEMKLMTFNYLGGGGLKGRCDGPYFSNYDSAETYPNQLSPSPVLCGWEVVLVFYQLADSPEN